MKPRFRVMSASQTHEGMTLLVNVKKITKDGVVEDNHKPLPVVRVIRHGIGDGTVIHCWDNDLSGPIVLPLLDGETVLAKCVIDSWGDWVIGYPWVITSDSVYAQRKRLVDGVEVQYLDDKPMPVRSSMEELERRNIANAYRIIGNQAISNANLRLTSDYTIRGMTIDAMSLEQRNSRMKFIQRLIDDGGLADNVNLSAIDKFMQSGSREDMMKAIGVTDSEIDQLKASGEWEE